MIQNIVIGEPIVSEIILLSDERNANDNYKEITFYTEERYLPKILVELKIFSSIREVKRNRKDLDITLMNLDCIDLKISKRKLYIVVGV